MNILRQTLIYATLSVAASLSPVTQADDCKISGLNQGGQNYTDLVIRDNITLRDNRGCFGGAADDHLLRVMVDEKLGSLPKEFNNPELTAEDIAEGVETTPRNETDLNRSRSQLSSILTSINSEIDKAANNAPAAWTPLHRTMERHMARAKFTLTEEDGYTEPVAWERDQGHGLFCNANAGVCEIDYLPLLQSACASPASAMQCETALGQTAILLRHAELTRRVLHKPVQEHIARVRKAVVKLDEQWDYYWGKARSQYIWELAANDMIFDPDPGSLSTPPKGQLILGHLGAVFEYVPDAPDNANSLNGAALIEIIGYNWLRWPEDGSVPSKVRDWPLGVSLAATWLPGAAGDDWGYGPMLHVNNIYSVGASYRDTGEGKEWTVLLSIDLAKLFLKVSKDAKEKFQFGHLLGEE